MKQLLKKIIPAPAIRFARSTLSVLGQATESVPNSARILRSAQHQTFFGYYDISPFSNNGHLLLAQRAPKGNISPHIHHPELTLGYYDLRDDKPTFKPFGKTNAWNWQQGCRLQWFPASGERNSVIYNTHNGTDYVSVIQDVFGGEIQQTLSLPVYSVSPDGAYALTLDFERLHNCRPGYGYNNFGDKAHSDEIKRIDIASGNIRSLMTMENLRMFQPLSSMEGANHYFNHLCVSPSGKRFMVTHLWVSHTGKRYSRLIVADSVDGNNAICPNNSGHTSHYCWIDDDDIVVFGRHADGALHYYAYDLHEGTSRIIGRDALSKDGHPSWLAPDGMLTDTYPNLLRQQALLLYGATSKPACRKIARFHVPESFTGEVRCDLHPRLNKKKDRACIDIVRDGRRAMCIVDIQKIII